MNIPAITSSGLRIVRNTLPVVFQPDLYYNFSYSIIKFLNPGYTGIELGLCFFLFAEDAEIIRHSYEGKATMEIESSVSNEEKYKLFYKQILELVDVFRNKYATAPLHSYPPADTDTIPYPSYSSIQPLLQQALEG